MVVLLMAGTLGFHSSYIPDICSSRFGHLPRKAPLFFRNRMHTLWSGMEDRTINRGQGERGHRVKLKSDWPNTKFRLGWYLPSIMH